MPLSWNEIKDRALKFSHEWGDESSEDAEAKSFWDAFFTVFGVSRRRVATFEEPVKKSDGHGGFIDLLWKGILLVEHKSRGKNLDRAFQQAKDYFPGLKDRDLPRYILVSDFARFRLYDLEEREEHEFTIKDFYKNVRLFGFVAGYVTTSYKEQDPVNIKAAERMGGLHDRLKAIGYEGHELEVYLVRLLFCLFADATSIFERRQFQDLIEQRTGEDGQDLAQWLEHLFEVLNTPREKRLTRLDEQLAAFQYVNGSLFAERLRMADFDRDMRETLIECCGLNWGKISPAIFGALFQSVMKPELRRNLGAHYTTEKNILKVIGPLFLDELRAEFERVKGQKKRLVEFHQRIAKLKFLDPACGCGNFLVIAYRELRLLELDILRVLYAESKTGSLDVSQFNILCDVDQFFGIEIEEFPAQIAQTALWLMDHQMNMRVSEEFGNYFVRLPLKKSATIVHGNALQRDWREIVKPTELSYILGNPPFIGHHLQTAEQKQEMLAALGNPRDGGVLDFVTAWYAKAVKFIQGTNIKVAFVSTNSITQGEQVGILWRILQKFGNTQINFAHKTFRWSSEARGKAAVYCVIIGFSERGTERKLLFDYETPDSEPQMHETKQINAYLADAPWVLLENRSTNLSRMPEMMYGSKPTDGGFFLFDDAQKIAFIRSELGAKKFIKPFLSAHEYLHGEKRWVLWLVNADSSELRKLPKVMERIESVSRFRKSSKAATTRSYPYPTLFRQVTQPKTDFILIPAHTSENRFYIPFGFFDKDHIVGNSCFSLPNASLYHFGIISSAMHMAWVRTACGRLESRYRYSKDIVYNNFPWPQAETAKQRQAIEQAAQAVLDARARHADSCLADLYDPLTMPSDLVKAHHKLDAAVDAAYSKKKFSGDSDRVAFLFELYQQIVSPLEPPKPTRRKAVRG
jgi:hypothetical protein